MSGAVAISCARRVWPPVAEISRVAHEALCAYGLALGEFGRSWEGSPAWFRRALVAEVEFLLAHPEASAEATHAEWCLAREADGWKVGPVLSVERREDPNLVAYGDLPVERRAKTAIFVGVVRALEDGILLSSRIH